MRAGQTPPVECAFCGKLGGDPAHNTTHGGKRTGAGRKPLPGGGSKVISFTLDNASRVLIARWMAEHDSKSASEALRQIIERSAQ